MRRRSGFRGWAMVWAVLQFALPAAATLADARLERDAAPAQGSHAESRSEASCRALHPEVCALCQIVSRSSAPSGGSVECPVAVQLVEAPARPDASQHGLDGEARRTRARAPPVS